MSHSSGGEFVYRKNQQQMNDVEVSFKIIQSQRWTSRVGVIMWSEQTKKYIELRII